MSIKRNKMEDDLRPPSIAYIYEEPEMSSMPAGTGSMPGKPATYVEGETELISGRGCIP